MDPNAEGSHGNSNSSSMGSQSSNSHPKVNNSDEDNNFHKFSEALPSLNKRKLEEYINREDEDGDNDEDGDEDEDEVEDGDEDENMGCDDGDDDGYDSDDEFLDRNDPDEVALHEYNKHVAKSQGFHIDINKFPKCLFVDGILPLFFKEDADAFQSVHQFTHFAIDEHNKLKGENLKLVEVLMVNYLPCAGIVYYITFEAMDTASGEKKTYQTKVYQDIDESLEVLLFRPQPKPESELDS